MIGFSRARTRCHAVDSVTLSHCPCSASQERSATRFFLTPNYAPTPTINSGPISHRFRAPIWQPCIKSPVKPPTRAQLSEYSQQEPTKKERHLGRTRPREKA